MKPGPQQTQLSPPSNPSHFSSPSAPILAPTSELPLPPKTTRSRRPRRKKDIKAAKLAVNFNSDSSLSIPSVTSVCLDSSNNIEQINPREPVFQEELDRCSVDPVSGEQEQSVEVLSESTSGIAGEPAASIAALCERPTLPCQQVAPCSTLWPCIATPGIPDEPTSFNAPLCDEPTLPCQQVATCSPPMPGITPSVISNEPTAFILPLREGPTHPCPQIVPCSAPPPGIAPTGFPVKIIHFGPPPRLLPMGPFFGPPPMVTPFHSPHTPIARFMGPPPPVGHFVGSPHQVGHFVQSPPPTNTYFRPFFWDPRNPYGPHPYANAMMPAHLAFPGYSVGPQRRRLAKTSKPRKPRRKTPNIIPNNPTSELQEGKYITLPNSGESSTQETIMDEALPQETIVAETVPQQTIIEEPLPQCTVMGLTLPQETITEEPLLLYTIMAATLPDETVMAFSMDVPDMCNEVEVESTLSLNDEVGTVHIANETDLDEVNFSQDLSMNVLSLDLNHADIDREPTPTPPSPSPVKTRRMSHKKEQMKLVFDRKSDSMVKAAKGLFTKRTRTLYTWLYPNTSKREVKISVSKAWDSLPESEKAYYLAQVDGRLGIHPGLMVNPQLEGLVNQVSAGSVSFDQQSNDRADDSSEDHSSSDNSSVLSESDHLRVFGCENEAAKAVRNLFATNQDVEMWTSFSRQEADKTKFRRRKKRKSLEMSDKDYERHKLTQEGNSTDETKKQADGDAELEVELAKFRQILENDNNLNDDDGYWRAMPEPDPDELFLDII